MVRPIISLRNHDSAEMNNPEKFGEKSKKHNIFKDLIKNQKFVNS